MACFNCPYLQDYELLWREGADPEVICVMLWCCAGPELQVRRGEDIVLDEFYSTRDLVLARAEQLRGGSWAAAINKPAAGSAEGDGLRA